MGHRLSNLKKFHSNIPYVIQFQANKLPNVNKVSLIGNKQYLCEKIEAEMKQWKQQDEDVLTYALFPQVAKEFFESRPAKKPPVEKREILKAAAPESKESTGVH